MSVPTKPWVWVDSEGPDGLINAARLNDDFDALYDILDGLLSPDNVLPQTLGGEDAICLSDSAMQISAQWSFAVDPLLPVDTLIAQLGVAQAWTAKQTFSAGVDFDNFAVENLILKAETLPAAGPALKGRVAYQQSDNHYYGCNGSAWIQLDYIGGYTGGTVVGYSTNLQVDDLDSESMFFKTVGVSPTVKIALKGLPFPKRHYAILAYHDHDLTMNSHIHAIVDPGHIHNTIMGSHGHVGTFGLGTHYHPISIATQKQSVDHAHQYHRPAFESSDYIYTLGESADHVHSILGSTDVPSATGGVQDKDLGTIASQLAYVAATVAGAVATGTIAKSGVNAGLTLDTAVKAYGDGLLVDIDGTDVTSLILAATGWAAIGDGTNTHAFHTTGTGEMDISSWLSFAPGLHTIRVQEPVLGRGCKVMLHCEVS